MNILVVDDEDIQRDVMADVLLSAGYRVDQAASTAAAVECLRRNQYSLVLTDLKMPDGTGMDVLIEAKRLNQSTEVILMTAYGTIENAVQAMKEGAYDYIAKPFGKDELLLAVKHAFDHRNLEQENLRLRELVETTFHLGNLVGGSAKMRAVYRTIEKAVPITSTVLIMGESGTGKELVARAIHFNGPRAKRPFILVECSSINQDVFESELFGHMKGAFTGAHSSKQGIISGADGGTLFLDEITEIPPHVQAKLLRIIQEREFKPVGSTTVERVDVRIIAATNRSIPPEVAAGRFREDLYFRLNVLPITIPPLRERMEDIPALVDHFKEKLAGKFEKPFPHIEPEVIDRFMEYDWPGNVRELENVLERMFVLAEDAITSADLPTDLRTSTGPAGRAYEHWRLPDSGLSLEELEKDLIRQAMEKTNGQIKRASKLLGLTYKTFQYRLKKYQITTRDQKPSGSA